MANFHLLGKGKVAELLINGGANISIANNNGETPLTRAILKGRHQILINVLNTIQNTFIH